MADSQGQTYEDQILRLKGETWPRAGPPPAWAQHRQEMTDALLWFHSLQGGVQMTPKPKRNEPQEQFVEGILIAGYGGSRTYMDGEIVITSVNGSNGETPVSSQTMMRHAAMEMTITQQRPVGIVVERGATNPPVKPGSKRKITSTQLFPCNNMQNRGDSGQNCWVADYFLPVYMWPERVVTPKGKEGRIWMVKLEKWNLESLSWWANSNHYPVPTIDQRNSFNLVREETCPTCQQTSPRIYNEMFICLQDQCNSCWTNNGQSITPEETLTYTTAFLQERHSRPSNMVLPPLVEDFSGWHQINYANWIGNNAAITNDNVETLRRTLLKGFHCPFCSMLNRRIRWNEWYCRNGKCKFRLDGFPPLVTVQDVQSIGINHELPDLTSLAGYQRTTDLPYFTSYEYKIGEGCFAAYLLPKKGTNAMPGGSDELYEKMQEMAKSGEISLERRGHHSKAGPVLTNHFAANFGKSYRFSARVGTVEWDDPECPESIRQSRDTVNQWTAPYRNPNDDPANELYIAGYWASQRMGWHDDGEHGLQDLITTYTLGGQGVFKFRMKHKYNGGRIGDYGQGHGDDNDDDDDIGGTRKRAPRKTNWITCDPVIPGCEKEQERRNLKSQLVQGKITQQEWQQKFQDLMCNVRITRGLGVSDKNVRLQFPVNHGCLVLMYGPNTQKYFEHCVSVDSPIRFALTYRSITDAHHTGVDLEEDARRLRYDQTYDPGDDPLMPRDRSPIDTREPTPVPALSEAEDEPETKRPRPTDDDDDDDDGPNNKKPRLDDDDGDDDAITGVQMSQPQLQQQANISTRRGGRAGRAGKASTQSTTRSGVVQSSAVVALRRSSRLQRK